MKSGFYMGGFMKIYLITRLYEIDWDEHIAAVVIAENEKEVWEIVQKEFNPDHLFTSFPKDINLVEITYIGEPAESQEKGIVLASFNAG
jgi:hypothetical protein